MEEIFSRIEVEVVNPTVSNIQDWLSGQGTAHQKKRSGYYNASVQFREPFGLRDAIETTEEPDELRALRSDIGRMEVRDQTTITIFEEKLRTVEEEERKEVARQELLRVEEESRKFIISEFKEVETVEERKEMRRTLKEDLPFSLRSIEGWETRRGKEAFRFVFS